MSRPLPSQTLRKQNTPHHGEDYGPGAVLGWPRPYRWREHLPTNYIHPTYEPVSLNYLNSFQTTQPEGKEATG